MEAILVGCGQMGRRHIEALKILGITLVAIVDKSAESIASAIEDYQLQGVGGYESLQECLIENHPYCVVIATTADTHAEFTCMAAKSGAKFIFVEKPMATSVYDCLLMRDTCELYGTKLSVNHQMRFMDQYRIPRDILLSPEHGGMTSMTVVAGNFGLAMNGTHYLEAFRYLAQSEIEFISGWFSEGSIENPRGPSFFDRGGALRGVSKSGQRFYLDAGVDQGYGLQVIYGSRNGSIYVDELLGKATIALRKPEFRALPTSRYGMQADITVIDLEPAEVIHSSAEALRALIEDKNYVNADNGIHAVQALVAAHASHDRNGSLECVANHASSSINFPWA